VRRGGTVRLGAIAPSGDVEPLTVNDGGAAATVQTACEYLCFPSPDLRLQPRLATGWRPGRTVAEWTFTLRHDVRWHDGSPLTVEDVVASFDRYADPALGASAHASFRGILEPGNVERLDERTVRFHLARPYADFPYLVSALNYSAPILPRDYEAGDFARGGVGTGAYRLEKLDPRRGATYVRHDAYWGGSPQLDKLEIRYFDEARPMVRALEEGEIGVVGGLGFIDAEPLFRSGDIRVYENPSSSYRPVHLRVDTPPFDDRRVRQALGLALDRETIINSLLGGHADLGNDHAFAPIFPLSPRGVEVPQRRLDLARAKQLLAEAGRPRGFSATLTTLQYEDIPRLARVIRDQLYLAGVELELKILPQAEYFGSGARQPWLEVPMGIVYWASRGTPSQLIAPAYLGGAVWNSAHWRDKRFDDVMARFDGEVDVGRRRALAIEGATLMQEETPALIPYWLRELRAVRREVHGVAPGPNVVWDPSSVALIR
jgi:peptide/nickel transport system substrate-binding protein